MAIEELEIMKALIEKIYSGFKNDDKELFNKKLRMFKRMLTLIACASGYDKVTAKRFAATGKFSTLKNPSVFIEEGPVFQRIQKEYVTIAYKLGANEYELDNLQEAVIDQAIENNKLLEYGQARSFDNLKASNEDADMALRLMADEVYPQKYLSGKAFFISPSSVTADGMHNPGIM